MGRHRFTIPGGIYLGAILLPFGAGAALESQAIELTARPGKNEPQITWANANGQDVFINGKILCAAAQPVVLLGGMKINANGIDANFLW